MSAAIEPVLVAGDICGLSGHRFVASSVLEFDGHGWRISVSACACGNWCTDSTEDDYERWWQHLFEVAGVER